MAKRRPTSIEPVETGWTDLVLVCSRCGKDGFGPDGDIDLRRALKRSLREAGRRRDVGVVSVRCLGICPRRAVTIGLARQPGQLLVIPEGEPAGRVLQRLGLVSELDTAENLAAAPPPQSWRMP